MAVHAAAAEPRRDRRRREAILERAAFALGDWLSALAALADIEARMAAVLDELGLASLVTTIQACPPSVPR